MTGTNNPNPNGIKAKLDALSESQTEIKVALANLNKKADEITEGMHLNRERIAILETRNEYSERTDDRIEKRAEKTEDRLREFVAQHWEKAAYMGPLFYLIGLQQGWW